MLRAYKGRYENGSFVLPEFDKASIPNNASIIITILEDTSLKSDSTQIPTMRVAAQNFLKAVQDIRKEGFSPEDNAAIDELQSGKYKPVFEERL